MRVDVDQETAGEVRQQTGVVFLIVVQRHNRAARLVASLEERFPDLADYERVRNAYRIDRAAVERFGEGLKILHPLPRVNEVDPDVDAHPGALYFQQVRNGVTVRMALLHAILGGRSL